ncbi:HipA domain-containing protein [Floccifex sp.]|uniref:HipA domain-containing protein n=1 Tax=Floccifex sp. TaxID=2815810 RepID=UPI003F0B7CC9
MTLLGKVDGSSAADGCSYLDIVSFIKAYGSHPKDDLLELWKRIVFNMAISNTDDHLRNHAFILTKNGWNLSPLYNINPVPYGDELSLNVDEQDNQINIEIAIKTAKNLV